MLKGSIKIYILMKKYVRLDAPISQLSDYYHINPLCTHCDTQLHYIQLNFIIKSYLVITLYFCCK